MHVIVLVFFKYLWWASCTFFRMRSCSNEIALLNGDLNNVEIVEILNLITSMFDFKKYASKNDVYNVSKVFMFRFYKLIDL